MLFCAATRSVGFRAARAAAGSVRPAAIVVPAQLAKPSAYAGFSARASMATYRLAAADVIAPPTDPVESAKREAARRAVDDYVRSGMAIGVGSGSTIVYAIQRLAERAQGEEGLRVRCVPTSFQARQVRPPPPARFCAAERRIRSLVARLRAVRAPASRLARPAAAPAPTPPARASFARTRACRWQTCPSAPSWTSPSTARTRWTPP